jgi:AcrR family transcriptional regulator
MTKGADTKLNILNAGLEMASRLGLESVTIGSLAKATSMSKSGVFAHFQSKENLQIEILRHAGEVFAESVLFPALAIEDGADRIREMVANWIHWTDDMTGGCIFVSASNDFKDRPGKVQDFLTQQQAEWVGCLQRLGESARRKGVFRPDADCKQFAYELYSLLLGYHYYQKLLQSTDTHARQGVALEKLLDTYR